jgi:hypothetical protein
MRSPSPGSRSGAPVPSARRRNGQQMTPAQPQCIEVSDTLSKQQVESATHAGNCMVTCLSAHDRDVVTRSAGFQRSQAHEGL